MGSSIVEPLMLVFLVSVLAQKSTELREGGLVNIGILDSPAHPLPPPFLLTPTAPHHPITGSVSIPSVDPNRGSSSLDKGVDTGVPVPTGLVTPSIACWAVQSSGQLVTMQVGSILATSGLTAAQAEEIFLLSHEMQTLRGKLALEFIELSHSEAKFCMGAQATGHAKKYCSGASRPLHGQAR